MGHDRLRVAVVVTVNLQDHATYHALVAKPSDETGSALEARDEEGMHPSMPHPHELVEVALPTHITLLAALLNITC